MLWTISVNLLVSGEYFKLLFFVINLIYLLAYATNIFNKPFIYYLSSIYGYCTFENLKLFCVP